jgi:hypothetical protein
MDRRSSDEVGIHTGIRRLLLQEEYHVYTLDSYMWCLSSSSSSICNTIVLLLLFVPTRLPATPTGTIVYRVLYFRQRVARRLPCTTLLQYLILPYHRIPCLRTVLVFLILVPTSSFILLLLLLLLLELVL